MRFVREIFSRLKELLGLDEEVPRLVAEHDAAEHSRPLTSAIISSSKQQPGDNQDAKPSEDPRSS